MAQWVKFYTETLHDRKVRKLSERDQLVFFKLILLAGQEDKDGELPPSDDIAMDLYMKEAEVIKSCDHLMKIGLLSNVNGVMVVTNYEKRQSTHLSDAERSKKYRENKRNLNTKCDERHETVTQPNVTPVTQVCDDSCDERHETVTQPVTIEKNRIEKNRKEKNREELEENRVEKNKEEYIGAEAPQKPQKKSNRGILKPFGIAENVMLSDSEYQKLQDKLGKDLADKQIDELSLYMGKSEKNAKKYTNHYFTVLSWSQMSSENPISQQSFIQPKKKTYDFSDVFNMMQDGSDSGEVIDI